jgi:hypothetical protein
MNSSLPTFGLNADLFGANAYAGQPTGAKQAQPTRDAADVLTVAGSVQGEAGYRSQIGDGKGGVAGTGLGESHEFVLRAVRTVSTETLKPIDKPGRGEDVYLLTGKLESELGKAVGHQVAVSGYVKVKRPAARQLRRINNSSHLSST